MQKKNISTNSLCYGCRACENACGKQAIIMKPNEEGFLYPYVEEDKCVDCGICLKVCPTLQASDIKYSRGDIYAAQARDKKILMGSSSGGAFSVIATYVLMNGGVVFGAYLDEKLNLYHKAVENLDDLSKLRGSKYFQCDTLQTYKQVRNLLRGGRMVYYTGTPCQIAGLRLFLHRNYDNLITSDLICHGVPSGKLFHMFVQQMEKERFIHVLDYKFRDKRKGWGCSSSAASLFLNKFKFEVMQDYNMDAYFKAFIQGHITRMDCYSCKFCSPERVGDITIADYWTIDKLHPEFPGYIPLGVSLVSINSAIGRKVWKEVTNDFISIKSSVEQVLRSDNRNFYAPTRLPKERKNSYQRAFHNFKAFRRNYVKDSFWVYNFKNIYRKLFVR